MKKIVFTLLMITFISAKSITVSYGQQIKPPALKTQIVGVWLNSGTLGNKDNKYFSFGKYPISPTFKIISADSTYVTISMTFRGPTISGSGLYEITNDSTYVEHIQVSGNQTLIGKKANITTYMSPDSMSMSGKFFLEQTTTGEIVNQTNTEYWERVLMPNSVENLKKLNTKERVDKRLK